MTAPASPREAPVTKASAPAAADAVAPSVERARRVQSLDRWTPWGLGVVALALRLAFAARVPTEWDSVQLVMGVDRFDVGQHSPHPPGYWLYIGAARAVRTLTPLDAHGSLLALAAVASAATVAVAYLAGRAIAGRWLGLAAAGFLFTSPFLWFYGSSVGTYAFDALACSLLILLAAQSRSGSSHGIAAAAVLGLAGGFRQTSLLVLLPIALVAAVRSNRTVRAWALSGAAGAAALAVWTVPMLLEQPGGLAAWRLHSGKEWSDPVRATSLFYGAPAEAVRVNVGRAFGHALAGAGLLLPVAVLGLAFGIRRWPRRRGVVLLALALVPGLAFTALIHFGKAGYVLSYLPAAVLLLVLPAANLGRAWKKTATALVVVACLLQAQRFAMGDGILPARYLNGRLWFTQEDHWAPYRVTAQTIDEVDVDTRAYRELGRRFDPDRHVLVYVFLNGGQRFRHAMLTLPAFTAHLIDHGVDAYTGRRLQQSHERDGRVELPPGGEAVVIVDSIPPDLQAAADSGAVRPVQLRTGPTVWVAPPGTRLFGVEMVEAPAAGG